MELFHKEISDLAMVGYIEGLKDLNATQIENACQRTLREVDHMPSVAHIRSRVYDSFISTRPEYLDSPPISEEERAEALAYSDKFKETLVSLDSSDSPYEVFNGSFQHDKNMENYQKWVQETIENENLEMKQGCTPVPRSKEEQEALLRGKPLEERRRIKWTKLRTKNT